MKFRCDRVAAKDSALFSVSLSGERGERKRGKCGEDGAPRRDGSSTEHGAEGERKSTINKEIG